MRTGTVYRCSDGRYYGDVDVWKQFESGDWTPSRWDEDTGREWVQTGDGELHTIAPVSRADLPESTRIEHVPEGFVVTDGREIVEDD